MKTVRIKYNKLPKLKPTSAAIGYFDGFHLGHQQLLEKAKEEAGNRKIRSAVITFDPDPWTVFRPDENRDHLLSEQDKEELAEAMGADCLYVIEFSKDFAALSPEDFIRMLAKMNVQNLVCGFDYTFGYKGSGTTEQLEQQNLFDVEVIAPVRERNLKISSSRIESLLRRGLVFKVNELLGYDYSIAGTIVHGFSRGGSLLNCPTANLKPDTDYVLPGNGVYAGWVAIGKEVYPAMINIGNNPTFGNDQVTVEANILNFDQDIYGKHVRFFFTDRVRPEKRFSSVEDLKKQLCFDRERVEELLKKRTKTFDRGMRLWSLKNPFDIMNS